ncbi:MAG TPA: ATP-binding protein [Candidatus Dormibacteraeota bacterium]|jgi:energy-coupling factor transporter ATP-binding protein EcfA2|nr:ATP-binding protein [Candidatus Dormibacteraeota bacterium]
MAKAPRYIEEGLQIGPGGAWAWLHLGTRNYDFLTDAKREEILWQHDRAITALRDAECHLLVVPRPYQQELWADRLDRATPRPERGWRDYLSKAVEYLEEARLVQREVYLGVHLTSQRQRGRWMEMLSAGERLMGFSDPVPAEQNLTNGRQLRDVVLQRVQSHVSARLATSSELRWLIRRTMWRGIEGMPHELPPDPERRGAWGGELLALLEGEVRNHHRYVELVQPEGRSFMTTLAIARFPEHLAFPGSEWLYRFERAGFPLEASVRFRVVPPHEVAKEAGRKLAAAMDQAIHIAETTADLPLALQETAIGARELQHQVTKEQVPFVYDWPRLVVWAPTEEDLHRRATAVTELYRDMGIDVVRPSGEQLQMFLETLPGEQRRVRSYEQKQAVSTLAGSMYCATRRLGDGFGPYLGTTLCLIERDQRTNRPAAFYPDGEPVHLDPLRAALVDYPTGISITGTPGKGKTTLANYMTYLMRLRGAWVAFVDPKKEAVGLSQLPGLGRVQVIDLDETYEGLLDPFRVESDRADAALLAADLCKQFLPPYLARQVEAVLITASDEESQLPRPSLHGLVDRLARYQDSAVQQAAHTLRAIGRYPLARLCFAQNEVQDLRLEDALTIIQFGRKLNLPESDKPAEHYDIGERLSLGLMHMVTALVSRLRDLGGPNQPKAVVLDEAYTLTNTQRGQFLVERLARTGRSKNTTVVLVTQNAADLLNEKIRNCLSSVFAFGSQDETEVRAVLRLLGIEENDAHLRRIRNLESAECIFRDLEGRVGRLAVELVPDELQAAFSTTPTEQLEQGRQALPTPLSVLEGAQGRGE